MSPRAYRLGERQALVDETRGRIVAAARELLRAGDDVARFSMEAVARAAGVSRMTVYYQFGSRVGLLEAVCDRIITLKEGRLQDNGHAASGVL